MSEKQFLSISQQIELLKTKNLKFIDEVIAAQNLSSFGYYEIINGYRTTFLDKNKVFKDSTTFEDIFALYYFDFKLRAVVLETLGYAESYLKQKLAYTLAEKYGTNFHDYMSAEVFNAGASLKRQNPRLGLYSSRDLFFHEMKNICNDNRQPFKHYREEHGVVPPWILVKGMTFGNLRAAITLLNSEDKALLIQRLYSQDILTNANSSDLKRIFHETIKIINSYRNQAAHGGRMYNYFPDDQFTYSPLIHGTSELSKTAIEKNKVHSSSLYLLNNSMSLWQNSFPAGTFRHNFNALLENYSKKWAGQARLVLREMEIPENFIKK